MKYIMAIVSCCLVYQGQACLNEYGYTLEGKRVESRYFYLPESRFHFDTLRIEEKLEALTNKAHQNQGDFRVWSDIAANLLKLGHVDSALHILQPLAQRYSEEYSLMSNLGTAYELSGTLDSALKYISLGIELNPMSHHGSEWIHQKILEAKIRTRNSRRWMTSNPIIEMGDLQRRFDSIKPAFAARTINGAFFRQIRTRAPFTPAPNEVLANLLETLGDFNKEFATYENSLLAYTYALRFQNSNSVLNRIKDKIKDLNQKRDAQSEIKELPEVFIQMMKRSKLNPELLLLGLDSLALNLENLDLERTRELDSLETLTHTLDSLNTLREANLMKTKGELEAQRHEKYIYISLLGLLIMAIGIFILRHRSKKAKS